MIVRNICSRSNEMSAHHRAKSPLTISEMCNEVKQLRREAQDLKEVVAEQALELRLLKKSMIGDGGDQT